MYCVAQLEDITCQHVRTAAEKDTVAKAAMHRRNMTFPLSAEYIFAEAA